MWIRSRKKSSNTYYADIVDLSQVNYDNAYNSANQYIQDDDALYIGTIYGAYNKGTSNHEIYWSTSSDISNLSWQTMTLRSDTRPFTIQDVITVSMGSNNKDILTFLDEGFYVLSKNSGSGTSMASMKTIGDIYDLVRVHNGDTLPLFTLDTSYESWYVSFYKLKKKSGVC